jgi:hypothetical protein
MNSLSCGFDLDLFFGDPCRDLELEGLDKFELDEEFFIIMDDLRYAKQIYLKEEIIDKGFDPGQFTQYCQTLKGTEIDNYSFDELEEIVLNFQNLVLRNERRRTEERPRKELMNEAPPRNKSLEKPERSSKIRSPEPPEPVVPVRPVKSSSSLEKSSKFSIPAVKVLENSLSSSGIVTVRLSP